MVIDFHAHILPKMDDGSKSSTESLAMLELLAAQGVKKVVATPHFYANDESVTAFLDRRQASYERLQSRLTAGVPEILLGAEVKYYEGISRLPDLKKLCIQGSKLLLLEMPMAKWTGFTVRELLDLSGSGKVTIVLAHVERYVDFQQKDVWQQLLDHDVFMQVNASCFTRYFSRRKILGMLKKETVHFIGSDCHNMSGRPPNMGKAFAVMKRKLGEAFVDDFVNFGNAMFL